MDPKENGSKGIAGYATECGWSEGLTKREHFAAMAMQGLALHAIGGAPCDSEHRLKYTAREAVKIADALLRALSSPPANEGRE